MESLSALGCEKSELSLPQLLGMRIRKRQREETECFTKWLSYKNIFDGASAAQKRGNYFGPLAGAKGSLCQQGTDIESVPIWLNTGHE